MNSDEWAAQLDLSERGTRLRAAEAARLKEGTPHRIRERNLCDRTAQLRQRGPRGHARARRAAALQAV